MEWVCLASQVWMGRREIRVFQVSPVDQVWMDCQESKEVVGSPGFRERRDHLVYLDDQERRACRDSRVTRGSLGSLENQAQWG